MPNTELDALSARMTVQAIALQEMLRVLSPSQRNRFGAALQVRVDQAFPDDAKLDDDVDATVAGEVVALLVVTGALD